jgi:hypothetical protein
MLWVVSEARDDGGFHTFVDMSFMFRDGFFGFLRQIFLERAREETAKNVREK